MFEDRLIICDKENPPNTSRSFCGHTIKNFDGFSFSCATARGYVDGIGHCSWDCIYFSKPYQAESKIIFNQELYIFQGTTEYDYFRVLFPKSINCSEWIVDEKKILNEVNKFVLKLLFEKQDAYEFIKNLIEEERKDAAEKAIAQHNEVLRALLGIRESIY